MLRRCAIRSPQSPFAPLAFTSSGNVDLHIFDLHTAVSDNKPSCPAICRKMNHRLVAGNIRSSAARARFRRSTPAFRIALRALSLTLYVKVQIALTSHAAPSTTISAGHKSACVTRRGLDCNCSALGGRRRRIALGGLSSPAVTGVNEESEQQSITHSPMQMWSCSDDLSRRKAHRATFGIDYTQRWTVVPSSCLIWP